MSALDVLRQIKQARRAQQDNAKVVEWGNAEYINTIGIENLTRRELRNHLEARDLPTTGTRLELIDSLKTSITDEQLHKFAYTETLDTEQLILADMEERGSVYVCGINEKGQLGLGDLDSRKFFTVIPSLRGIGVEYVASGMDMAYAVTHEHDVYVWGGGGTGKTGINPYIRKRLTSVVKQKNWTEPQILPDLTGEEVSTVVIGGSHCLAKGRGGDCFIWGNNEAGQLGLGHYDNQFTVCVNNSFPPVQQVACGFNHSAILSKEGQVYTWGHAANGRLGGGELERVGASDKEKYLFPVPLPLRTLETITQISCGNDFNLAVGKSGAWAWGCGAGGKLGTGDHSDRTEPVLIPRLRGRPILSVVAGTWHSMAIVQYPPIMKGGYLYSWGSGFLGQLAQGTLSVVDEPQPVEYFLFVHTMITQIAAGPNHSLAVTQDGELYSWGSNSYGALGRKIDEKDVTFTPVPGHVAGFGALVNRVGRGFPRSIACGREFSVVCTQPYHGPEYIIAVRLMEEARIREQEKILLQNNEMDKM